MANHAGAIPEWLTASYVEKILQKDYPNLEVSDIDVTPGSKVGDNYACQVFRIKVYPKNHEVFSIIAKYKPQTSLLDHLQEGYIDVFVAEAKFFVEIAPVLSEILGNSDFAPRCLHVDYENGTIFMDDLREKGFVLQERAVFMTLEQTLMTVEALATLHGASFIAIQNNPLLTSSLGKAIWNSTPVEPLKKMFENAQKMTEKFLSAYELSEEQSNKLMSLHERISNEFCKVCEFKEDRLNLLCHGDAWMNNMMFRYKNDEDAKNGLPESIMLLDFQIINYNSFANDLIYFLFSSVECTVLVEHLDTILQHYTEKLAVIAPDIPDLTFDRVKKEFIERIFFGFVITNNRAFMVSEERPDLEDIMNGLSVEIGFSHPVYISDIQRLLPFFEKYGL